MGKKIVFLTNDVETEYLHEKNKVEPFRYMHHIKTVFKMDEILEHKNITNFLDKYMGENMTLDLALISCYKRQRI